MPKLEVYGWSTEHRIFPITDKLADELTRKGVTAERLDEICDERIPKEFGQWGLSSADLEILVDDKPLPSKVIKGIPKVAGRDTIVKPGTCYLVKYEEAKGCMVSLEFEAPFDVKKLQMQTRNLIFPDDSASSVLNVLYDGQTDFGWSDPKNEARWVIFRDGGIEEVFDLDDEDFDDDDMEDDEIDDDDMENDTLESDRPGGNK